MGEDLSTGMKIGIGIIVLLAILAIVMSIMAIVKNIASSATNDLTSSLHNMQNLKMDSYNQKVVTGNEVLGFLSLNQDTGMSILISTAAEFKQRSGEHPDAKKDVIHNYCALLDCFRHNTDPKFSCIYYGEIDTARNNDGNFKSLKELDFKTSFFKDDAYNCYISSPTMDDNGDHKRNTVTDGIYSKTSKGYVNPDHTFHSYLVKDYSGTIIGVWFIEDAYTEYKKSLE